MPRITWWASAPQIPDQLVAARLGGFVWADPPVLFVFEASMPLLSGLCVVWLL